MAGRPHGQSVNSSLFTSCTVPTRPRLALLRCSRSEPSGAESGQIEPVEKGHKIDIKCRIKLKLKIKLRPGVEPKTFLLQDNSATNCNTMQPKIKISCLRRIESVLTGKEWREGGAMQQRSTGQDSNP
ncbi:hypothetical protein ILYODFUR_003311 [Ilyodon furcidens]|uniref:Uncharacterized protein n=1 Tax=Ilyodon furcidens TaxID=33524 RepID=A0ABV0U2B5_9TELE